MGPSKRSRGLDVLRPSGSKLLVDAGEHSEAQRRLSARIEPDLTSVPSSRLNGQHSSQHIRVRVREMGGERNLDDLFALVAYKAKRAQIPVGRVEISSHDDPAAPPKQGVALGFWNHQFIVEEL